MTVLAGGVFWFLRVVVGQGVRARGFPGLPMFKVMLRTMRKSVHAKLVGWIRWAFAQSVNVVCST